MAEALTTGLRALIPGTILIDSGAPTTVTRWYVNDFAYWNARRQDTTAGRDAKEALTSMSDG